MSKHDYRPRFGNSKMSLRLAWARHKVFWQESFGENVLVWVSQRLKELRP